MKRSSFILISVACLCLQTALVGAESAQDKEAARKATREQLRQVLETATKRDVLNVEFRQNESQPYNLVGVVEGGLTQAESLEIVISVSAQDTIHFRVYPHYKGGYINVDKAKDGPGLMRRLLRFSDQNFLYWGIDDSGDVFSGYTITLESGFPQEVVLVVLASIHNADGFVGQLRPFIDGSAPAGGS
jgi:hypothetical protein